MSAHVINSRDLEGSDVFSCSQHKKNILCAVERAGNEEETTRAVPSIKSESVFLDRPKETMNHLYVVVIFA